jgi:hypothetical protein
VCGTAESYTYSQKAEGYHKGFVSEVHSQIDLKKADVLPADDVAYLAWLVNDTVKKRGNLANWKQTALQQMLAHTHVIVAVNNDYLQAIWKNPTEETLNARMAQSRYACFEPVNNSWFFTVIAERFKKSGVNTIVHEMMHVVALVSYGELDSDHSLVSLWTKNSKEKSLQWKVLHRYVREPRALFQS